MATDIVTAPDTSMQSASVVDRVLAAASDPSIDAQKITQLTDLAIKLKQEERIDAAERRKQQFMEDYNAAVFDMPVISKTGTILNNSRQVIGRFAKFEDIDRVVKPIARQHDLGYTFECGGTDKGQVTVQCVIRHRNGYVHECTPMVFAIEAGGAKNAVQGVGSSNSYGKRYTLCNAFNIVTEGLDDDGNQGRTIALTHEREHTVETEANAAAEAGTYPAWFAKQSPKDRGWLVQSGLHARLGGSGPALTHQPAEPEQEVRQRVEDKPTPSPSPAPAPAASKKPAEDKPVELTEEQRAQMRSDWIDGYVVKVGKVGDLQEFAELQEKHKANLARFRTDFPADYERIKTAESAALDRLSGDGEAADSSEDGGDLFGGPAK